MENLSSSSDPEVDEEHTTEAEKESPAPIIATAHDTPPLIEKDGPSITMENVRTNAEDAVKLRPFFFEPIKIEKEENDTRLLLKNDTAHDTPPLIEKNERTNANDAVKVPPFLFEPIKIEKEENDTRLLFKDNSERKEIDFLGLWSSKEREEKTSMMEAVQECPVDDETSIDLTLRLAPPVSKKGSSMSTSDDKKRKMVAEGPSSSTSDVLDFKIGLPVNAQENVSNVVPPNPRELVLFGQRIVVHDQDPWKVKKVLTNKGVRSRLRIGEDMVSDHILPYILHNSPNFDEKQGTEVVVWDVDTESQHQLTLKRYETVGFVFMGGWISDFVKRRNLKENDEIGLKWDHANSRLEFKLLHRHR